MRRGDRARWRAGHRTVWAVVLLAAALWGGSCGYRPPGWQDATRPAPRLYLAPLVNATFRPGLHGVVTAAIQRQIVLDARLPLVEEKLADIVLGGRVTHYEVSALAFDRSDIGRRFRVRVAAVVAVREGVEGRHRFQGTFTGEAYYTAGDSVQGTRAAEDDAIQRAALEVGGQLVTRLLEEW